MYQCEDCGKLFEEPQAQNNCLGEFHGRLVYLEKGYCPHCGSEEYYLVEACQGCGRFFNHADLLQRFCPTCGNELSWLFSLDVGELVRPKSKQERIYLASALTEGEELITYLLEALQ